MISDEQNAFEKIYGSVVLYQVTLEKGEVHQDYFLVATSDRVQHALDFSPQSFDGILNNVERVVIERQKTPVVVDKLTLERIASLLK